MRFFALMPSNGGQVPNPPMTHLSDMALVNTKVLVQPYNWLVVGLIAAFWLILLAVLVPQPTPEK